jgi:hypothetical protein
MGAAATHLDRNSLMTKRKFDFRCGQNRSRRRLGPLVPQERAFVSASGMSEKYQKRKFGDGYRPLRRLISGMPSGPIAANGIGRCPSF